MAAPLSPPFKTASRDVRSSLESWTAAPWHCQQLDSKTGWISLENEMRRSAACAAKVMKSGSSKRSSRTKWLLCFDWADIDHDCTSNASGFAYVSSLSAVLRLSQRGAANFDRGTETIFREESLGSEGQ